MNIIYDFLRCSGDPGLGRGGGQDVQGSESQADHQLRLGVLIFINFAIEISTQGCGSGSAWIRIQCADPHPGGENLGKKVKQKKCKEIGRNCIFIIKYLINMLWTRSIVFKL